MRDDYFLQHHSILVGQKPLKRCPASQETTGSIDGLLLV